jgi:hypothetical protein
MTRALPGCVAVLVLVGLASATPSPADSNLRPQLSLGSSVPMGWEFATDRGAVLGAGLEIERSPRVSGVVSLAAHMLDNRGVTAYAANFGVRLHAAQNSRMRPYAQAGLGGRVTTRSYRPISWAVDEFGMPSVSSSVQSNEWGATAHLGVGFTSATYHGAGLFFDASIEAMLNHPRDFALAPFRVGITLP